MTTPRQTETNPALDSVRKHIDALTAKTGHRPKACTRTFGCQQNEADTERLRGQLACMGYELTGDLDQADLMLLNTCAVREHAESRALGHLGALTHWKNERPGRLLVLCGCMPQQSEVAARVKQSFPHVDILFGAQALPRFPALLERCLESGRRVFDDTSDSGGARQWDSDDAPPLRAAPPKAWIPIMSGCDNFCSYCIVPYVRGRERSRPAAGITSEIGALLERGYKDFTLLGQNVNSYRDPGGTLDFAGLLREICSFGGEYWVRFMTSHPKDCTPELLSVMSGLRPVARHLHLPVQSGSDKVLEAMNRGYTSQHYMSLVARARELMPDLTITSDIIVGFPGESEQDFEDTLRLVEHVRFDMLFTFLYSGRRGTPAAALPGLPRDVKQRRFDRLLALQNSISLDSNAALSGTVQRVLIDGCEPQNDRPLTARTSGGKLARLEGGPEWIGRFADAEITSHNTWNLFGKVGESDVQHDTHDEAVL